MDRPPSLGERALSRFCLIIQPEHCQRQLRLVRVESSTVLASCLAWYGGQALPPVRTECCSAQTNVPTRTKAGPALGRSRQTDGAAGGGARQGQQHPHAPGCLTRKPRGSGREGLPFDAEHPPQRPSLWCVSPTYVARRHCDWRRRKDRLPVPVGRRPFGYCPPWMASTDSPVTSANRARGKRGRGSRIGYLARCQCRLSSMRPLLRCRNPADARAASAECHPDKGRPVQYRTGHTTVASLVCLCPCAAARQSTCLVISKDPWMLGGLASHAARRRGLLPAPSEEHMMGGR